MVNITISRFVYVLGLAITLFVVELIVSKKENREYNFLFPTIEALTALLCAFFMP